MKVGKLVDFEAVWLVFLPAAEFCLRLVHPLDADGHRQDGLAADLTFDLVNGVFERVHVAFDVVAD